MNIDFDIIKRKCPKSYDKFLTDIAKVYNKKFTFCYCDLERFFDENGIIIEIGIIQEYKTFYSDLYNHKFENIYSGWCDKIWLSRDEAKEQAIYKAFGIMEASL
jgi:hypothetical protein